MLIIEPIIAAVLILIGPLLILWTSAFLCVAGAASALHAHHARYEILNRRPLQGGVHATIGVLWVAAAVTALVIVGFDPYLGVFITIFGFWLAQRTLRQLTRNHQLKTAAIAAIFATLVIASPAPAMAQAAPPQISTSVNVVELVNFACPHCQAEAQYTPQIAAATRAQGGLFRIAPIGPQKGGLPAPAVFIYYATASVEHNDSEKTQAIAQALYDGYKAQADLANNHGVLSWLQTQIPRIPYRAIQQQLATNHPEKRFDKAAWLAIKTSASVLPTFIYLSVATGAVIGIDQWQGEAPDLTKRVLDHLEANR